MSKIITALLRGQILHVTCQADIEAAFTVEDVTVIPAEDEQWIGTHSGFLRTLYTSHRIFTKYLRSLSDTGQLGRLARYYDCPADFCNNTIWLIKNTGSIGYFVVLGDEKPAWLKLRAEFDVPGLIRVAALQ